MREIKFRAWFPKEHYSEPHMAYLDIDDEFGGASATWQLRYLQHPEPDGPIYMQYTGLQDKNGVEIYQSDRCAVNSYLTGVVRYKESMGAWYVGGRRLTRKLASTITIVGNIHESN
jgi:YopX protein